MGASDRHHFAWLREALGRFDDETGRLHALAREVREPVLWCLAEHRLSPAIDLVQERLGPRVRVSFFDKYPTQPGVRPVDINRLEELPDRSCDVLTLFRASYFIEDPETFLVHTRRLLRPGGLAIVDWLHGGSDAPRLDLAAGACYGGVTIPFRTTYADAAALAAVPGEFGALIRHVNRPPAWANLERPGAPVPLGERLARMLGRGPRQRLAPAAYLDTVRGELRRAGKRLVEPDLLGRYFTVVFRDARYFYARARKFNLYLLTVLEPVGAAAAPSGVTARDTMEES